MISKNVRNIGVMFFFFKKKELGDGWGYSSFSLFSIFLILFYFFDSEEGSSWKPTLRVGPPRL